MNDISINTSRADHLAWCKARALKYVGIGDVVNAFASMTSDLNKHAETKKHIGIELGTMLLLSGHLSSKTAMKDFIEGFN